MEVRVIQIDDMKHFSQFRSLPPRFIFGDNEYRIIRNEEKVESGILTGDGFSRPYDLRITHGFNVESSYDPTTATLQLCRYSKDRQHMRAGYWLDSDENYQKLWCSVVDLSKPTKPIFLVKDLYRDLIIRPVAGARSMGFMEVPKGGSTVNLRMFFTELSALRGRKDADGKVIKSTNAEYQKICDGYGIKFSLGGERDPNEVAGLLDGCLFVITPKIEGFKEYRVLIGGAEAMIMERDHNADPRKYADPLFGELIDKVHPNIDDILKLLSNVQDHGSFDLWTKGKEWGLFEFQPQYGHEDIPDTPHLNFMMTTIDNLYKTHCK